MIGIKAIGTYLPKGRINNQDRMSEFSIDESFLKDKSGMLRLAVKADDEDTSDLCCKAFDDLISKTDLALEELECVIVCTQNPDDCGLPHTSAIVHAKLDLPENCAVFDISLGCSGYVYGLSILQSFMMANDLKTGILFTADPYSKVIDKNDKNTSLLFGDGATATLVSTDPKWTSGKFLFGSQGKHYESIRVSPESNELSMNGRGVFSFSATVVPSNIRAMLTKNELDLNAVDRFILHQGSRFIVETITKKLGIDPQKAPFFASDYGNTISSSIPFALNTLDSNAKNVVIAGFGVGLSWASTVLYQVS